MSSWLKRKKFAATTVTEGGGDEESASRTITLRMWLIVFCLKV